MFIGTFRRTVDDKWRLPLPNDLVLEDGEGGSDEFYFAPAGNHLLLFSKGYFDQLARQVHQKSVLAHRELRRKFFGNSYKKVRDNSGRVQIPEPLRDRSGLSPKAEAVLVGTGSYLEIHPGDRAPAEPDADEMVSILDALERLGE